MDVTYERDSFPFSPSLPLFFPAIEKSGHGGPPIKACKGFLFAYF